MRIAVYSFKGYEKEYLERANQNRHTLVYLTEALSENTVHLAEGAEAVSVFTNDDACAPVIQKLKASGIKYIATRAAGYDNIDLNACREAGIKVANVPAYSPYAIAEHTIAMILALNRRIVQADRKVKEFDFSLDELIGFDLNGKTVGIVGLGQIGGIVAKILNGFGCDILAYDIKENKELIRNYDVRYCSLEELSRRSDIITVHAPLNAHTKYMINKKLIDQMKDGVMIVNTGRGGLLNTADAIDGLKSGKIGYLGLDVYEKEKGVFFYDHSRSIMQDDMLARLMTFKNVLITGHQAFLTSTALGNIADTTIDNLHAWSEGRKAENEL